MALHQAIPRVLLIGVRLDAPPAAPAPQPPRRLLPLIESLAGPHRSFDARAVHFGHRYRSGFWCIYLLSALAVLFAMLPLSLGWDSRDGARHPFAGIWAIAEIAVIATVSIIYWLGARRDWQGEWLRTRTTAELTWYLPLLAPLVDFSNAGGDANWYTRLFDPGDHVESRRTKRSRANRWRAPGTIRALSPSTRTGRSPSSRSNATIITASP